MEHEQKRYRKKLSMLQGEPDKIGEINCESHLRDRQDRLERPVLATAPGLRLAFNSILGRTREIGLMIKDGLEYGARIIERKADPKREQTRKQEYLLHPSAGIQFSLRTNVEDRDGD